jgi:F0F1-type ATP synthase delta subunit
VIKEKYQAEEVELEMIVDKELKGGIKIVVGEEILDNSIAGKINKLRNVLVG